MSEPVSNPYKLTRTCENCHHSIWNEEVEE
jgi:hypothetical protein